jgi:phosphomannomutase
MTDSLDCFKAYDVRGRIPDQLNEDIARRIGRAYAEVIQPGSVVVGHDIRLTSESIKTALVDGLREQGVAVQESISPPLILVLVAGLRSLPATIPKTTTA